jgi:hypothetical protein
MPQGMRLRTQLPEQQERGETRDEKAIDHDQAGRKGSGLYQCNKVACKEPQRGWIGAANLACHDRRFGDQALRQRLWLGS